MHALVIMLNDYPRRVVVFPKEPSPQEQSEIEKREQDKQYRHEERLFHEHFGSREDFKTHPRGREGRFVHFHWFKAEEQ